MAYSQRRPPAPCDTTREALGHTASASLYRSRQARDSAGREADQTPERVDKRRRLPRNELVQQQAAFGQQQTALLQLQTETVRLQRLLIERALGTRTQDLDVAPIVAQGAPAVLEPPSVAAEVVRPDVQSTERVATTPPSAATPEDTAPPIVEAPAEADTQHPPEEHEDSPLGSPARLYLVSSNAAPEPAPAQATTGVSSSLRAARYLQAASTKAARVVSRQDVERLTRLHEAGDAAHLVLGFGEHKGSTLLHVARTDPDYVRRLALSAQCPQGVPRRAKWC
jgi:hypothetical protein